MTDIFLSYSRDDQATARLFAEGLEAAGFSVWWDVTLKSGEDYDRVTEQALRGAKAVVVLWSAKSVESRWVRTEATIALQSKTLVPVMITPCQRPIMFELTQTEDLCHWQGAASDKSWQAFVADVRHFIGTPRDAGAAAPVTPAITQSKAFTAQPWHRQPTARLAAAAITLLIFAVAGYALLQPAPNSPVTTAPEVVSTAETPTNTPTSQPTAQPTAQSTAQTLAILPLTNLSTDAEQEYFADGLTDELINILTGVKGLDVTGRASAFYFKGKDTPLMEIGEMLGVAHVLQGSVRKSDTQLRITVQLTKTADGFSLWSQNFDRPMADVFAVQDEIATAVAKALSVALGIGDMAQPGMTRDVAAYDEYLLGRADRNTYTRNSVRAAIGHFQRATSLDPDFALAWYFLARAYGDTIFLWPPGETGGMAELRVSALDQAKALAPEMDVLLSDEVFRLARQEKDYLNAETLARTLAERDPAANSVIHGRLLEDLGLYTEVMAVGDRAKLLNPLMVEGYVLRAQALAGLGRFGEARSEIAAGQVVELDRDFYYNLSWIEMAEQQWDAALEASAHLAFAETNTQVIGYLQRGDIEGGRMWLQDLVARREQLSADVPYTGLPIYAAMLGLPELAASLLEDDNGGFSGNLAMKIAYPFFADMRKLPAFKEVMQRQGMATFWRTTGRWPPYCSPVGSDDFECH